jgi:hypothetical protein
MDRIDRIKKMMKSTSCLLFLSCSSCPSLFESAFSLHTGCEELQALRAEMRMGFTFTLTLIVKDPAETTVALPALV